MPEEKLDGLLAGPLLDKHTPIPNPFQRSMVACTGTEFYSPALTKTKARTARVLRRLRDNVDVPDDVSQLKIHYSGYTIDYEQTSTVDIGLFGMRAQGGGEMVEAMDIGVSGGTGEEPSFVDWVQQRAPADEVPGAITSLVGAFAERRGPGQTSREWVDAEGTEAVMEYCVPEKTEFEAPYMHDAKQSQCPFAKDETQSEQAVTNG